MSKRNYVEKKQYQPNRVYQTGKRNKTQYQVTDDKGKVVKVFNNVDEARNWNNQNLKTASTEREVKQNISTTPYKLPVSYFDKEFLDVIGYGGLPDTSHIVYRNAEEFESQVGAYSKWKGSKDKGPSTTKITQIGSSHKKFNKSLSHIENIGEGDTYQDDIDYTAHLNKKVREMELEYNKLVQLDPELKDQLDSDLKHARALRDYHIQTIEEHGKGYWKRLFWKTIDRDEPQKPKRK